jgi:hypothetical protein
MAKAQRIRTRYMEPTYTVGSRIIAKTMGSNDRRQVTIPYPYELSGVDVHLRAARKLGWYHLDMVEYTDDGYIFEVEA